MRNDHSRTSARNAGPGLGIGVARRRIWRGLVLPLVIAACLYGGFRIGLMLGMVQAIYQQIETHAPRAVQIGQTILALPEIERQIAAALAHRCQEAAAAGLVVQAAPRAPAAASGARATATWWMRPYPRHWPAELFSPQR